MKKQTLLVGIAATSTVILWSIAFNFGYLVSVWVSDFMITEVCVFLSYGSFENYYRMLGCQFCENKCCKCIDNVIDAKLNNNNVSYSINITKEIEIEIESRDQPNEAV